LLRAQRSLMMSGAMRKRPHVAVDVARAADFMA